MIENGANVDEQDIDGKPPLHLAADTFFVNTEIVKVLIKMAVLQLQGAFCDPQVINEDVHVIIDQHLGGNPIWHNYDKNEFKGSDRLNLLSLQSPTTVVEQEAFADCKNLLKLEIKDSITIKDNAFKGCDGLSVLILNENSPFRNSEELERIGITHKVNIMTGGEYNEALEDFKKQNPEPRTFSDRQIDLFYCLLLPKQNITLQRFAEIFSNEQAIPSCVAVKIPGIVHEKQDDVTKCILQFGMFSAEELKHLPMVSSISYYRT